MCQGVTVRNTGVRILATYKQKRVTVFDDNQGAISLASTRLAHCSYLLNEQWCLDWCLRRFRECFEAWSVCKLLISHLGVYFVGHGWVGLFLAEMPLNQIWKIFLLFDCCHSRRERFSQRVRHFGECPCQCGFFRVANMLSRGGCWMLDTADNNYWIWYLVYTMVEYPTTYCL